MSRDVLDAILAQMDSSADRFALAKVDHKMHEASKNWSDVNSILINGTKVLFGKENTAFRVIMDKKDDIAVLSSILTLCPSTRRWYIEAQLSPQIIQWMAKQNKKIQKLYISNENFDTRYVIDLSPLVLSACQALYILEKSNKQITTKCRVPNNMLKNLFPASLRRVCLTGVTVDGPLLRHLANLPSLASLDLLGTVTNTENTKEFIKLLENNSALEELSLAPSMFSFSTKSNNKDLGFTFRDLQVAKLSVYMLVFDDQWFSMQLKDWFSKDLKTLVLYGNCAGVNLVDNSIGFKLLVGPMCPIPVSKGMTAGSSLLISHLVRQPPYITSTHNRAITASSWKCDIDELIREQEASVAAAEQLRIRAVGARRARLPEGIVRHARVGGAQRILEFPVAVAAVVAASPVNPAANVAAGEASTSTVPTASSRSYVTTPFPTNSSVSNESVNRDNFNVTSMELVSSINATSPAIPAEASRPQVAVAGQNAPVVVAIEPLATSTPMMTSQRENNTNAVAAPPFNANAMALNERIPNNDLHGNGGGAMMRNEPNGPITGAVPNGPIRGEVPNEPTREENGATANAFTEEMEEAFEDLLLATMATMLAEIDNQEDGAHFHDHDHDDEHEDMDVLTPEDVSPVVSPIFQDWIPLDQIAANDLHTAIEPPSSATVTRVGPVVNSNGSAPPGSASTAPPSNAPSTPQ